MFKNSIESMNALQMNRLSSVTLTNSGLKIGVNPPTKSSGLYWIYTSYSNAELAASTPCPKAGSVEFRELIECHQELNHICKTSINGYRVVYNGIGGVGPKGHGGLRERILEEFRGGQGTGSLAINGTSVNNLEKWRFSYVLWPEIEFDENLGYDRYCEHLERAWRLHYGWPVLCKK